MIITPSITCPLAATDITRPLEHLTAEEARNCVKAFDGLPYSPADAKLAALVAKEITEKSRLGFGEVQINSELPEKMVETLRRQGFKVTHVFYHDIHNVGYSEPSFVAYCEAKVHVQWDESLPLPEKGEDEYYTLQECKDAKQLVVEKHTKERAEARERVEKEFEEARKKQADEFKARDILAGKTVEDRPPSGGCFSLLAISTAISALIWFCV